MKYMLDTNVFLRFLYGGEAGGKLSDKAEDAILNVEKLYMSVVSLWEIAIKIKINKLNIKSSIQKMVDKCIEQDIIILPIKAEYLDKTLELPFHQDHKDPFDRLILSTSFAEGMILISSDHRMTQYGVSILW